MSTKSAQNGQALKAAAKKVAAAPTSVSVAARVTELEREIAFLRPLVPVIEQMSQILRGIVEQQAVAAAMPEVESRIRAEVREKLDAQGFLAPGAQPAQT